MTNDFALRRFTNSILKRDKRKVKCASFNTLSVELILIIFSFLNQDDIKSIRMVCKLFNVITNKHSFLKHMTFFPNLYNITLFQKHINTLSSIEFVDMDKAIEDWIIFKPFERVILNRCVISSKSLIFTDSLTHLLMLDGYVYPSEINLDKCVNLEVLELYPRNSVCIRNIRSCIKLKKIVICSTNSYIDFEVFNLQFFVNDR